MFWLIASLLCIAVVVLVVFALVRTNAHQGPDYVALNAAVLASQRSELERDLHEGVIDENQYRQAISDLEQQERESQVKRTTKVNEGRSLVTAGVLALAIPAVAIGVYTQVGNGTATVAGHPLEAGMEMPDVLAMVERLQQRLEENPDDLAGWSMLIRSFQAMGRVDDAIASLRKAFDNGLENADLYVQYADMVAVQQESLRGEPERYIAKALELDPDHWQALWLAGSAALETDMNTTLKYWERLYSLLEPDSEDADIVLNNIKAVRAEMENAKP